MEEIIRIHSTVGLFEENVNSFIEMGFSVYVLGPSGAIMRKQVLNAGAAEAINYKIIITRRG